jgi:hypothetical protein
MTFTTRLKKLPKSVMGIDQSFQEFCISTVKNEDEKIHKLLALLYVNSRIMFSRQGNIHIAQHFSYLTLLVLNPRHLDPLSSFMYRRRVLRTFQREVDFLFVLCTGR